MPPFYVPRALIAVAWFTLITSGCASQSPPTAPSSQPGGTAGPSGDTETIRDDAALFRLISVGGAESDLRVFPNAEEFTTGRLDGSEAHRPIVRTLLNTVAARVLQSGRLPPGTTFSDGALVVKEIRSNPTAPVTTYAVMYRARGSSLAGGGWIWAEYGPGGSVQYSVQSRGSACVSCHLRDRGPQNDLVRTFERQF